MKELIVRWYQFGCFSPVFRTHGCRKGPSEPDTDACRPAQGSCGFNEIWSYGADTQVLLEKYVRLRATLKPYLQELNHNVSAQGVPTMRPLAYEFPADANCRGIDDQYMLGPTFLVAPVTAQNATSRKMYFPAGARWQSVLHPAKTPIEGGQTLSVPAPLDEIPAFVRVLAGRPGSGYAA
jgi:alpha-D-xyloside xylohydrolase